MSDEKEMVTVSEDEYRLLFEKDPEHIRQLCRERRLRVLKDRKEQ